MSIGQLTRKIKVLRTELKAQQAVVEVARKAAAMQIVEQWELQEAIAALDASKGEG